MATAADSGRLPYKWRVLISVIFGIFMVILDTTVVNVAFPTLRLEYRASLSDAQWILSLYVMALGIATPLSGFLADRVGIKRTYVAGLVLFVAGSLLCGLAPNLGVLIAARALQGFGGGIALPLGTALLFSAFPVAEQGVALGIFGIALVVAPALGPILGGLLVDQNVWRLIFFINVPIGLLGVFLASRWLRERRSDRQPRFDVLGFVAATVGFGSVLYAASIAADDGWTSQRVLFFFGLGAVGLAALVVIELFVAREPLLNLRLFRLRIFTSATLVGWVSVVALFGAEFLLPLYLQTLRGRSALETGVILLPLAVTAGIATPLAGIFYDKVGPRILIVVGFGLLMLNTWQLSQLQATTPIPWILLLLAVRGLALGMTVQTTLVASLSVVERSEVARASALTNATRQVVQSIGVAVLATILVSTLSQPVRDLQRQFQAQATSASSARTFALCEPTGLPTGAPAAPGAPPIAVLLQRACAESITGYEAAYKTTFYFALVALLLGLTLPGWPLRWRGRSAAQAAPAAVGEQLTTP